jgi:hypothetical protein
VEIRTKNHHKSQQPKTTVEIGRLHHLQTVGIGLATKNHRGDRKAPPPPDRWDRHGKVVRASRRGGLCFAAWWWLASPWVSPWWWLASLTGGGGWPHAVGLSAGGFRWWLLRKEKKKFGEFQPKPNPPSHHHHAGFSKPKPPPPSWPRKPNQPPRRREHREKREHRMKREKKSVRNELREKTKKFILVAPTSFF